MERKVPDVYTQTRAEFGQRAITTARAVQGILRELISGYAVLNYITPPHGGTTGQGGEGTGTSSEVEDSHNPYFLHDAIKALDELIAVTEERYL